MGRVVEERSPEKTIVQEAPVQSKGSNGHVERAVQEIEGTIRSLLLNLRERLGCNVDARERIVAFIPGYAAYLLNRLHEGADGKVPYERARGKNPVFWELSLGKRCSLSSERALSRRRSNPGGVTGSS